MRKIFGWWRPARLTELLSNRRPHLRIWSHTLAIFSALPRLERRLFGICLVTALFALSGIIQTSQASQPLVTPLAGGVYREGILLPAPRDFEAVTTRLTRIGLIGLSETGDVQPALATAWQMSDDLKTLRVTLDPQLTAEDALRRITEQTTSGYWKDATITVAEPTVLQFVLTRPWASFIKELATPIFPYGPYQLEDTAKPDSSVVNLTPNPHALAKPYLKRIELHFYPDAVSLDRAIRKGSVDGAYAGDGSQLMIPSDWSTIHPQLGYQYLVFFNVRNPAVADANVRRRILRGEHSDQALDLHFAIPDTPLLGAMAEDLKTRWAPANINLIIEPYPILTLTKSIITDHNYDVVLLGIDYGADGDPFPFWHSSQIASPGLNLAGFRNKEVDQLLDDARIDPDQAKRQDRYHRVQEILDQEAVVTTLSAPQVTFARSHKIKGPLPTGLHEAGDRWRAITTWYQKEKVTHSPKTN